MKATDPGQHGFTLIELMVTVAILGILMSIAIPAYQDYTVRAKLAEALTLAAEMQPSIRDYHKASGAFPADNAAAGVPEPEFLIGNYVKQIEIENGAIHVTLGNHAGPSVDGEIISIRPLVVDGSPASPISWTCANRAAPEGMSAVGENRTSVQEYFLPGSCR